MATARSIRRAPLLEDSDDDDDFMVVEARRARALRAGGASLRGVCRALTRFPRASQPRAASAATRCASACCAADCEPALMCARARGAAARRRAHTSARAAAARRAHSPRARAVMHVLQLAPSVRSRAGDPLPPSSSRRRAAPRAALLWADKHAPSAVADLAVAIKARAGTNAALISL